MTYYTILDTKVKVAKKYGMKISTEKTTVIEHQKKEKLLEHYSN